MVTFQKTCRQCYTEKGQSVAMKQDAATGEWFCPFNPKHYSREDDIMVA